GSLALATMVTPETGSTTSKSPNKRSNKKRSIWRSEGAKIAYVFIAPYVLFFTVFRIIPTIYGIILSFGKYSPAGELSFLGLDNYRKLIEDDLFWNSLKVTGIYAAIAMPLTIVISLAMAQLCNRALRGIAFFRALYFLPAVTASVLSGLVFIWIFSDSGSINALHGMFGLWGSCWLQISAIVMSALALVSAWMNFGYKMLIPLAGMLVIPEGSYEAASLGWASTLQPFTRISLPR